MSERATVTETAKVGDELVEAIGQKLDLAYSRHRQNNYLGSYSDYRREVLALITAARRDALERAATMLEAVIATGYPAPPKAERCEHGKFAWEDCGACYDDTLDACASAIRALIDQDTARGGA